MTVSWEQVAEATGAEMVGGHLQAHVNGKNIVLGHKVGTQFTFTEHGEAVARHIDGAASEEGLVAADIANAVRIQAEIDAEEAARLADEEQARLVAADTAALLAMASSNTEAPATEHTLNITDATTVSDLLAGV